MRIPLSLRAARACALAALVLSLDFSPSYARMGGSAARPAFGGGHIQHSGSGGFNRRFETGRSGFDRLGPKRFDRFGFNHFRRFGWNPLLIGGGWGWGGFSGTAVQPLIVGDSAPVIIDISLDSGTGDAGAAYSGGCVIHKLNYDSSGKYVGERQIPHC